MVVVEQTETPAQLAVRNEERKKQRLPKVRTCNACARRRQLPSTALGSDCDREQPLLCCALYACHELVMTWTCHLMLVPLDTNRMMARLMEDVQLRWLTDHKLAQP